LVSARARELRFELHDARTKRVVVVTVGHRRISRMYSVETTMERSEPSRCGTSTLRALRLLVRVSRARLRATEPHHFSAITFSARTWGRLRCAKRLKRQPLCAFILAHDFLPPQTTAPPPERGVIDLAAAVSVQLTGLLIRWIHKPRCRDHAGGRVVTLDHFPV